MVVTRGQARRHAHAVAHGEPYQQNALIVAGRRLPVDVWLHIMEFLDTQSVLSCQLVSKAMYDIASRIPLRTLPISSFGIMTGNSNSQDNGLKPYASDSINNMGGIEQTQRIVRLLSHFTHLEILRIGVAPWRGLLKSHRLLERVAKSLPRLRAFSCVFALGSDDIEAFPDVLYLLKMLPSITSLELAMHRGILPDLDLTYLHSLTFLNIEGGQLGSIFESRALRHIYAGQLPDQKTIEDLLQCCPALETISLKAHTLDSPLASDRLRVLCVRQISEGTFLFGCTVLTSLEVWHLECGDVPACKSIRHLKIGSWTGVAALFDSPLVEQLTTLDLPPNTLLYPCHTFPKKSIYLKVKISPGFRKENDLLYLAFGIYLLNPDVDRSREFESTPGKFVQKLCREWPFQSSWTRVYGVMKSVRFDRVVGVRLRQHPDTCHAR